MRTVKINVRVTPFEGCILEATYRNWLPQAAASAGETPAQGDLEADGELPPFDPDAAVALLQSWHDEDPAEQRDTWEKLKVVLKEDRLSDRELFP